jgi:hypothetical protein
MTLPERLDRDVTDSGGAKCCKRHRLETHSFMECVDSSVEHRFRSYWAGAGCFDGWVLVLEIGGRQDI